MSASAAIDPSHPDPAAIELSSMVRDAYRTGVARGAARQAELQDTISSLQEENKSLRGRLEKIAAWSFWWKSESKSQLRGTMKLINEESAPPAPALEKTL